MYRKELAQRLRAGPVSVLELSRELQLPARELEEELRHLERSLRNEPGRLVVQPARCRKCDFVFREDKMSKPGKCPECRATWIEEPQVSIED